MELGEIVEAARAAAKQEGASQVEVFAATCDNLSVYVDDSKIKSVEQKRDIGAAVRIIKGRKVGQSASSCASSEDARACAVRAVSTSSLLPRDPVFTQFPAAAKGSGTPRTWDDAVAAFDAEQLKAIAMEAISTAAEGGGMRVPNGLIRTAAIQTMVWNSNGVEVGRSNTLLHLHMTSMTKGKNPGEGVAKFDSPSLKALDPTALGQELRRKAQVARSARAYKGHANMTVLIPPDELAELIEGSIGFTISAENVNRRRSAWAAKMGATVASKSLTVEDDPFHKSGPRSMAFDDEGVPTTRKKIIDKGVLSSFVNDSYNALKSKVHGTGNGLRCGNLETLGHYMTPVQSEPINLVITAGRKSVDQIIASLDEGLVIEHFAAPDVHPITGAFGLEVRSASLVKNGEATEAINHALLTGNMFQALQKVVAVANDVRTLRSSVLPSIAFGGLELVGAS
jgi:PmbA protein